MIKEDNKTIFRVLQYVSENLLRKLAPPFPKNVDLFIAQSISQIKAQKGWLPHVLRVTEDIKAIFRVICYVSENFSMQTIAPLP